MVKTLQQNPPRRYYFVTSYVPEDRFNNGLFRIRDMLRTPQVLSACRFYPGVLLLNRKEGDGVSQNYVDLPRKVTGRSGGRRSFC